MTGTVDPLFQLDDEPAPQAELDDPAPQVELDDPVVVVTVVVGTDTLGAKYVGSIQLISPVYGMVGLIGIIGIVAFGVVIFTSGIVGLLISIVGAVIEGKPRLTLPQKTPRPHNIPKRRAKRPISPQSTQQHGEQQLFLTVGSY